MSWLQSAKLLAADGLGLGKDALHVYIGLLVQLGSVALLRWRLRDWKPWLAVLAVAVAGELWDVYDTLVGGSRPVWRRNWHDIWNTLFWPTALMLLARHSKLLSR